MIKCNEDLISDFNDSSWGSWNWKMTQDLCFIRVMNLFSKEIRKKIEKPKGNGRDIEKKSSDE